MKPLSAFFFILFLAGCTKDASQELALAECQRQLALTQRQLDTALARLEEANAERHRNVEKLLRDSSVSSSEFFQPP
ncbi:MAG: hypothetical protein L0Z50_27800, partial [Verrucomicrobiales bacterium]|nr:hypothetical protein [Verrucomicrobiales bacterium]